MRVRSTEEMDGREDTSAVGLWQVARLLAPTRVTRDMDVGDGGLNLFRVLRTLTENNDNTN